MKAVFQFLKGTVAAVLRFGIAYAVFFYVAHFSGIQSVVLSVLALCAVDAYRLAIKTATNQQPQFEPFWVSVQPNWYSICHDFGLAAGEEWTEFQNKCETSSADYSVMRNGLNFTMLSPTLFYSNDHQRFFGHLDLKMSLEELKPDLEGAVAIPSAVLREADTSRRKERHSGNRIWSYHERVTEEEPSSYGRCRKRPTCLLARDRVL